MRSLLCLALVSLLGCSNDDEVNALRAEFEALKAEQAAEDVADLKKALAEGMVEIPGGTFKMELYQGKPRTVTLSKGFHISKTEMTHELFNVIMNPPGVERPVDIRAPEEACATCATCDGGVGCPVEVKERACHICDCPTCPVEVSWYEAVEFCNQLSVLMGLEPAYSLLPDRKNGRPAPPVKVPGTNMPSGTPQRIRPVTLNPDADGYRLPTEAEWFYAAKVDEDYYHRWDSNDEEAWTENNSGGQTHPVGTKAANAWGLYDMSGNVSEWVWDWYENDVLTDPTSSVTDPLGYHLTADGVPISDKAKFLVDTSSLPPSLQVEEVRLYHTNLGGNVHLNARKLKWESDGTGLRIVLPE